VALVLELGGVEPTGGGLRPDLEEERPRLGRDAVGVVVVSHPASLVLGEPGTAAECATITAMSPIAAPAARKHLAEVWTTDIIPTLCDFIRIPNVSVAFEPGWSDAGHMARAV